MDQGQHVFGRRLRCSKKTNHTVGVIGVIMSTDDDINICT